jgi:hypothetical protein
MRIVPVASTVPMGVAIVRLLVTLAAMTGAASHTCKGAASGDRIKLKHKLATAPRDLFIIISSPE